MSLFHSQLALVLKPVADYELSQAGNVYVVSSLLSRCGIFHQCRVGYLKDKRTNMATVGYCWIELSEGWVIDLSCPYESTEEDPYPKLVFQSHALKDFEYVGTAFPTRDLTDAEMDDFIGDLFLPTLKNLRACWFHLGIDQTDQRKLAAFV